MEVIDALSTGELIKGEVIAGGEGVSNKVLSIEVMEVPEVATWITPGILVMTAFYSIKDYPDKQTEIVQSLIDVGAAGIVIKIGRFINSIPDKMMEIANEYRFPIISIPNDTSYINVLTPLYEKLYMEKQQEIAKINNPFHELAKMNFSSLYNAIEKVAEIVKSPVYIEDIEGRLLYISNDFRWDGWRNSSTLFSKPDSPTYMKMMEKWKSDFHTKSYADFDIQGFRSRIVLPLFSKSNIFAFVHILYKDQEKFHGIPANYIEGLGNKLSELFMTDQLYLQKNRIDETELFEQYLVQLEGMNTNKLMNVVHFYASWLEISDYPSSYLIDYSSLIRRKLHYLVNQLSNCTALIFEKSNKFYALTYYDQQDYPEIVRTWDDIINKYNEKEVSDPVRITINPTMKNTSSLEEQIHSVTKMMEIGYKIGREKTVYTHDQLGIYEILLNLTSDSFVKEYTANVLLPLQNEQKDLIETLKTYLNVNGNVSRASEILFIHRRTMSYRLQKVEELLNMNLNDSTNRFILRFCLFIEDLS